MKVKCRKANAIGIFYWVDFPDINTKTDWFSTCLADWELMCFEPNTPM